MDASDGRVVTNIID